MRRSKIEVAAKMAVIVLTSAWLVGSSALTASALSATSTITGRVVLAGGPLTIAPPPPLAWRAPLVGSAQFVVDGSPADQRYVVNDATGSGRGWNVTVDVSPFSCDTGRCSGSQLPLDGTLTTNGSLVSPMAPNQPSATCLPGASCILPQNQLSYPVAVPTAHQPVRIFDSAVDAGRGAVAIGGRGSHNPVGWWLTLGNGVLPGAYVATMSVAVNAGP